MSPYHIRQCQKSECRFRYPMHEDDQTGLLCPKCQTATIRIEVTKNLATPDVKPDALPHVEVMLDNIRSVYNVGSLFRTADGAGVRHIHLCGITATPKHPQLAKTALGADSTMRWSHNRNGLDTARALKGQGYQLIALEDTPQAHNLFDTPLAPTDAPHLIIVGHEKIGVDPQILALCDQVLRIPMVGIKDSLNVAVAFGIALYQLMFQNSSVFADE